MRILESGSEPTNPSTQKMIAPANGKTTRERGHTESRNHIYIYIYILNGRGAAFFPLSIAKEERHLHHHSPRSFARMKTQAGKGKERQEQGSE